MGEDGGNRPEDLFKETKRDDFGLSGYYQTKFSAMNQSGAEGPSSVQLLKHLKSSKYYLQFFKSIIKRCEMNDGERRLLHDKDWYENTNNE